MAEAPVILLIDDDPAIRRLCTRMLERLGFIIHQADQGASGKALFENHLNDISLVLLDLHLPDVSGKDLAKELAALSADTPVVYFTGGAQTDSEISEDGVKHLFLKKPFTKDSLVSVIQQAGVSLPPSAT